MAKIGANGAHEVARWVFLWSGKGVLLRSDGALLSRIGDEWKQYARVKAGITLDQYLDRIRSGAHPEGPAVFGETPPSLRTLMRWESEGACDATDGCRVEPDGTCPHGYQSWLRVQSLI